MAKTVTITISVRRLYWYQRRLGFGVDFASVSLMVLAIVPPALQANIIKYDGVLEFDLCKVL